MLSMVRLKRPQSYCRDRSVGSWAIWAGGLPTAAIAYADLVAENRSSGRDDHVVDRFADLVLTDGSVAELAAARHQLPDRLRSDSTAPQRIS